MIKKKNKKRLDRVWNQSAKLLQIISWTELYSQDIINPCPAE